MTWKHIIFYLLIILISSCSMVQQQLQSNCSEDDITNLQEAALDAENNNNKRLARDNFERICDCQYSLGCLNASGYYKENDPKGRLLQERACDLENGSACFWLGESTKGNIAKTYYEKGCSFSIENAHGISCRVAGVKNIDNYDKASFYLEKGCLLGDITSCIEAYRIINEPIRKHRIKKLSCEIGIPEVCK